MGKGHNGHSVRFTGIIILAFQLVMKPCAVNCALHKAQKKRLDNKTFYIKLASMKTWAVEEVRALQKKYHLARRALDDLVGVTLRSVYYCERGLRTPARPTKMLLSRVGKDLGEMKKEGGEKL
jgi:hypothetical protein